VAQVCNPEYLSTAAISVETLAMSRSFGERQAAPIPKATRTGVFGGLRSPEDFLDLQPVSALRRPVSNCADWGQYPQFLRGQPPVLIWQSSVAQSDIAFGPVGTMDGLAPET